MMKKYLKYILMFGIMMSLLSISSCKKDWLEAKPDKTLTIPETLEDIEALLNSITILAQADPSLVELGTDDYILSETKVPFMQIHERNSYLWASDIFGINRSTNSWSYPYQQIVSVNVALETLEKVKENNNNSSQFRRIKGMALFYRSWSFFALMGVFAKSYDNLTASLDLGIPLRLSSNINEKVGRATVQECYDKIISDLKEAVDLIGDTEKENKLRASKEAVYGLLSRVYLSMREYDQALTYADKCLKLTGKLMDYNNMNANANYPFMKLNEEVIYSKRLGLTGSLNFSANIDNDLYNSYSTGDLRKSLFFKIQDGKPMFKGSYKEERNFFSGIATDELYLTRAECYARKGNIDLAMKDLNDLLRTRWVYKPETTESSFINLTAQNADDALGQILIERRKELLMRGIRWIDLRRLNKDPRFAKTLTRTVNGKVYTLPPNSNRYVYPIPRDEVDISGIPQNNRD